MLLKHWISLNPPSFATMPFRKISRDIKIAAMGLYDDNILPKGTILDYLCFSSWTFDCVHALWVAAGEVFFINSTFFSLVSLFFLLSQIYNLIIFVTGNDIVWVCVQYFENWFSCWFLDWELWVVAEFFHTGRLAGIRMLIIEWLVK